MMALREVIKDDTRRWLGLPLFRRYPAKTRVVLFLPSGRSESTSLLWIVDKVEVTLACSADQCPSIIIFSFIPPVLMVAIEVARDNSRVG